MMRFIAVAAIALAGLLHLWLVPEHYGHAPAHGIFLALAGIAELVWALAFWRRPTGRLSWAGIALAGGLIVLWAITRVLPAPFSDDPEPADLPGLIDKGSEALGIATLVVLAWRGRLVGAVRPSVLRLASLALARSLVFGFIAFGVAVVVSPLLPAALAHQGDHSPEARVIVVQATDTGYQPASLQISAGEPVIILLQNMGTDEHHFHIQGLNPKDLYWLPHTPKDGEQVDIHALHHEGKLPYHICNSQFGICPTGLDVHLHAGGGDYDMVGFTPTQAGTFKFNCPLPGHEERGMVGALTVSGHR